MRKAFNFYRSYWEVANELNDKDRLAFYDALLKKQFTGRDSQLIGMAKLAIISQKHSIDSQIDGYLSQMNKRHPNIDPWQGGNIGATDGAWQEEKEKGKEQVKVEVKVEEKNTIDYEFYFNLFWNAYDKKEGRSKSFDKFKKIKPELYDLIIDKATEYKKSTPDIQFRKNPLTWLNGQHWEDEIVINKTKNNETGSKSNEYMEALFNLANRYKNS